MAGNDISTRGGDGQSRAGTSNYGSAYLIRADVRGTLPLADGSVQCVVTSPPFYGLRDYQDPRQIGLEPRMDCLGWVAGERCEACYVCRMVSVFREVRRVLRHDGVAWLNLGDSFANNWDGGGGGASASTLGKTDGKPGRGIKQWEKGSRGKRRTPSGLKPKDLCMAPARVALALQADGWYLRSDCLWIKSNPMPESVTDRPTKAHEYVFLLAKGQWRERTIQFADLEPEVIHFGRNLGSHNQYSGTAGLCVRLASTIFDLAQSDQDFGLPPFYAEEWQERPDGDDSHFVSGLPTNHRAAAYAARLLAGNATTKEFLCQIHRLRRDLRDADHLLVRNGTAGFSLSPDALVDRDGSITVNDAGKISKVDLFHGYIIIKSPVGCNYFYDAEAEKVSYAPDSINRNGRHHSIGAITERADKGGFAGLGDHPNGANLRTAWTLSTRSFAGAHFAVFPPELPARCIRLGTSEKGACPSCGSPYRRVLAKNRQAKAKPSGKGWINSEFRADGDKASRGLQHDVANYTIGWEPGCSCNAGDPVPCVVLDCFSGSGTTAAVARELGRVGIGLEVNADYLELARDRVRKPAIGRCNPSLAGPAKVEPMAGQMSLLGETDRP